MKDLNDTIFYDDSLDKEQKNPKETIEFVCPNCKKISRDDVIFLCNTCKQEELIYKDGMYICPSCLSPGENFECMICGSKDVKIKEKISKNKKSK